MIEINKHPSGRISNIGFGLCSIADGLIRVFSLGFLHSTFALDYARNQARRRFQAQQRKHDEATAFLRSKLKATHEQTKQILKDAGAVYEEV